MPLGFGKLRLSSWGLSPAAPKPPPVLLTPGKELPG